MGRFRLGRDPPAPGAIGRCTALWSPDRPIANPHLARRAERLKSIAVDSSAEKVGGKRPEHPRCERPAKKE